MIDFKEGIGADGPNIKTEAEEVLGSMPRFEERNNPQPEKIILRGGNIEDVETEYKRLSEWDKYDGDKELIKSEEEFYTACEIESEQAETSRMEVEDGKVVLKPGMTNHRCSNSLDALKNISKKGVLASEWFGVEESEHEGAFCAFIDRIHDENERYADIANSNRLKKGNSEVLLFFDDNNPVMQKLIHMDYFEYEKIKQGQPELLGEIYTDKEIEIFDQLIEPKSGAGRKYHTRKFPSTFSHDWSAIPGGIPSALINGICTKNNNYSEEYLDELHNIFPNTTIFDGDCNVLRVPNKQQK